RFRANQLNGAPASQVWGNAALFDYQETWDFVHIYNSSDRELVTHLIDVVNGKQHPLVLVWVNGIPGAVSSPPNDSSLNEFAASGVTFEFDIHHTFVPTFVDIRNLQPGTVASSNIVLEGRLS